MQNTVNEYSVNRTVIAFRPNDAQLEIMSIVTNNTGSIFSADEKHFNCFIDYKQNKTMVVMNLIVCIHSTKKVTRFYWDVRI